MLTPWRRPLTPAEKRLLKAKIRTLTERIRRLPRSALAVGLAVFAALWAWTLLASDASWVVVSAFWVVVGSAITLWVRRDLRGEGRQIAGIVGGLESALSRNAADVYDIRAKAFAELEEIEDEGACYAFELEGGRLVFIAGQEFYESSGFPSLDFSLVYVLDEQDATVDMVIEKRGPKAVPAWIVPADVKRTLTVPEHLEVLDGRLDDLGVLLRPTGT